MILVHLSPVDDSIVIENEGGKTLCPEYLGLLLKVITFCQKSGPLNSTRVIVVLVETNNPKPTEETFDIVKNFAAKSGYPPELLQRACVTRRPKCVTYNACAADSYGAVSSLN